MAISLARTLGMEGQLAVTLERRDDSGKEERETLPARASHDDPDLAQRIHDLWVVDDRPRFAGA
jgi:hypothetical protein